MAKTKIDLTTTEPKNLTSLTKDAMLDYIIAKGTKEDKKWYAELCNANLQWKTNNLTKEKYQTPNLTVVREQFAKRFFPNLTQKKKAKSKAQSYMDKVNALLLD
jgi:hypothetical protein